MDDELDVAISFFISLMASLASLPFFLFTLPAGALADAFNAGIILRIANLWLAGCAGVLAFLGWAGILNPILLLVGVFVLGLGFAVNAPVWASLVPQLVTDEELPSALTLGGVQLNISGILGPALAGILLAKYVLMAMVHHCLYCLFPMALAGASWTLAASELWVAAQRAMPNAARGRISALMMVLSQGAMTLGAIVWGL